MNQAPLTDEERICARRKFIRHLWFMQDIEVFWVPSIRGIITRSIGAQREFRLPPGSISVGVYRYPDAERDCQFLQGFRSANPLADEFLSSLEQTVATSVPTAANETLIDSAMLGFLPGATA